MEAFLISILKVAAKDVFVRYARGQGDADAGACGSRV
jgi:hypothetical protein